MPDKHVHKHTRTHCFTCTYTHVCAHRSLEFEPEPSTSQALMASSHAADSTLSSYGALQPSHQMQQQQQLQQRQLSGSKRLSHTGKLGAARALVLDEE